MPFARLTVHHNFEVERQFAGRDEVAKEMKALRTGCRCVTNRLHEG
jgi:hypothetical protein